MGLDMYLTREVYVGAYFEHRNVKGEINITVDGKPLDIDLMNIGEIIEQAAYWRKANHIHKWFVDNVQDGEDNCEKYYVSREDMQSLLDVCNEVIANSNLVSGNIHNGDSLKNGEWVVNMEEGNVIEDPSVAHELLPVTSGVFFGGRDYDEWYLQDVEYTKSRLESILARENDEGDYYYQSSW